ncbi:hypothetical protein WOLCODRAFT_138283 [Wolfiporia cocos MD-104 SS10]|uniref:Uncharacterized protein n=1 Tax=Wolfiporia cocos (strain MD-104) TaxID=742152 RepID=A0A2H3JM60_WOLCO|nr:hypothetical protein WOLCODRAFT_138283 [Wolfiporia cocos MD-104 SS10]
MHLRLLSAINPSVLSVILVSCVIPIAQAVTTYWVVNEPTSDSGWANGRANELSWTKGLLDGIEEFDIEMQRLSVSGLSFIARNVPASMNSLNVYLQDVPTADDYYIMFMNVTHGLLYASSQTFSIAESANSSEPSAASGVPTVTISGSPNPTNLFATTFASSNGLATGWKALGGARFQIVAVLSSVLVCVLGGVLTVL